VFVKVGPIRIEKEDGYQQWMVSIDEVQNPNYPYTRWYSSHLYTPREALDKYLTNEAILSYTRRHGILDQIETALLFLDVSEME
jgi:hypothetical protein